MYHLVLHCLFVRKVAYAHKLQQVFVIINDSQIPAFGQTYITSWRCTSVVYEMPIKAMRQPHTTVDDLFHMLLCCCIAAVQLMLHYFGV